MILFLLCSIVNGETVNELLGKFEKNMNAETANQFFTQLKKEGFIDETIRYQKGTPKETLQAMVFYWSAEWFFDQQEYARCEQYGVQALPLFRKIGNKEKEADCLSILGNSCVRQSKYKQALEYLKQCLQFDKANGDNDYISSTLNSIAAVYLSANQPQEARNYILEALEYANKSNNKGRIAVVCGMASEIEHALANGEEALRYVDKAYQIEKELGRETKQMIRLSQKAAILNGMERYGEAEQLLKDVIPYLREKKELQSLAISCNKMGQALQSQERASEAVVYYREAADICQRIQNPYNELYARRGLYECLWQQDSKEAKKELDLFNNLRDSLYSNASAETLARYNAEFGNDRLREEIVNQRSRYNLYIILGVVSTILLLLALWYYMRYRQRKQNEYLTAIIENLSRETTIEKKEEQQESKTEILDDTDRTFLNRLSKAVMDGMKNDNLSVEQLAEKLCITSGHLNRKVKAVTGATTQQYVLRIRLEQARQLLKEQPNMTISEVAYDCGFNDPASFSRAFHRTFEMSPKQYREKKE